MQRVFLFAALVLTLAVAIGCSSGGSGNSSSAGAPSGLTATPGNGQVTLTWSAVSGVAAYNIYYGTTSGVTPSSGSKISAGSTTSYTQTGLVNGTNYYYVVTAVTSTGESSPSSQVSAKPVPTLPASPTGLTASAANGQVSISWNVVSGATSYNIYYGTNSAVNTANGTKISGITLNSYTQTGLSSDTSYYFIVTAVNMAGESPASAAVSAEPFVSIPPAPTGLTASAGNDQVAISWSPSPSATSYNVYCVVSNTGAILKSVGITTNSYTAGNLANGTLYYFTVTAQNAAGESSASSQVSAIPTTGTTIAITPGEISTGALQAAPQISLTFSFPTSAVTQSAVATITSVAEDELPVQIEANDSFLASFQIGFTPAPITTLNAPARISGNVGTAAAAGSTLKLAVLQNNVWTDLATFVVGTNGSLTENLSSFNLPGLLTPGTYLLYQPAAGSNTSVSNFGIALLADDGNDMFDESAGVQIFHLYDGNGNLLSTPQPSYLNYASPSILDSVALSPDGSAGIVLDFLSNVSFFSSLQTGSPTQEQNTVSVASYGAQPEAVAMLPNGDEAVVSAGSTSELLLISGILSGSPVAAATIPILAERDGLVLSSDGSVLLARGSSGLTVFSVAPLATPEPGSIAGTVSHSFTKQVDFPALGSNGELKPGREGMAISPADSSRAVVVTPSGESGNIQILTGLPMSAVVGPIKTLPGDFAPNAVSITPDGTLAVVGGSGGLLLYSGVNTGNLVLTSGPYAPSYSAGNASNSPKSTFYMGCVTTLGITLDGKYVVVGDKQNGALVVVPFTSSGFGSVAGALSEIAVPDNDELLTH